jgi:exodeoxyribonuclease-1
MEALTDSFYWYDLETSGTAPSADRIVQFAGLRTDLDLNPMDESYETYVKLPPDIVPIPESCLVTGITPQRTIETGRDEWEVVSEINRIFSVPRTCVVGFNNLRFDDEFVRNALYRNLLDPYAREWQGGNSRWDLIDLVRAAGAIRPEGIEWPKFDDKPSFRLEAMAHANNLSHDAAHDALSDVRATVALARLVRVKQPRLFSYALKLRTKQQVRWLLLPFGQRLCVQSSQTFSNQRYCMAPVMSIAQHPIIENSIITVDLGRDISQLIEGSTEEIRDAFFGEDVEERPPLNQVRINRCPFVAPITVVRPGDAKRLAMNLDLVRQRQQALLSTPDLDTKISGVFLERERETEGRDPEECLYEGFIPDADRACGEELQRSLRLKAPWPELEFRDPRMEVMYERLKARLRPETLSSDALKSWNHFVVERLTTEHPRRLTVEAFRRDVNKRLEDVPSSRDESILRALGAYGIELERRTSP